MREDLVEVDCTPFSTSFSKVFHYWRNNVDKRSHGTVVFAGDTTQKVGEHELIGWRDLGRVFK